MTTVKKLDMDEDEEASSSTPSQAGGLPIRDSAMVWGDLCFVSLIPYEEDSSSNCAPNGTGKLQSGDAALEKQLADSGSGLKAWQKTVLKLRLRRQALKDFMQANHVESLLERVETLSSEAKRASQANLRALLDQVRQMSPCRYKASITIMTIERSRVVEDHFTFTQSDCSE
jgi:hypothetical protein